MRNVTYSEFKRKKDKIYLGTKVVARIVRDYTYPKMYRFKIGSELSDMYNLSRAVDNAKKSLLPDD